jgi:hypothetical protein
MPDEEAKQLLEDVGGGMAGELDGIFAGKGVRCTEDGDEDLIKGLVVGADLTEDDGIG